MGGNIGALDCADEPKDGNQEAIRYFQFSEPISGGGDGGGTLVASYREKGEIGAYKSATEVVLFGYVQPRRSRWGKSLNYGENPASMAVSPSRSLGSGGLSVSWGGFRLGN